tara:strand:+ start:468 stop:587 length:120 start_codon:yes stop_codon:yes gene_type:complete
VRGISPLDEYEIGHDLEKVKKLLGSKFVGIDDEELKENL